MRLFWKDGGLEFPETYDQLEYIGFKWAGNHAMFTGSVSLQSSSLNLNNLNLTPPSRHFSPPMYSCLILSEL